MLNIENDFTPEEEAQIEEENRWAEQSFWVLQIDDTEATNILTWILSILFT